MLPRRPGPIRSRDQGNSLTGTIEIVGLRKRYGRVAALDGLDLTVAEGNVVGLLGPNGAGKTTALRIIVGLIRADSGTVTIEGRQSTGPGWEPNGSGR